VTAWYLHGSSPCEGNGDGGLIRHIWSLVAGPSLSGLARLAILSATRVGVLLQVVVLSTAAAQAQDPPPAAVVADLPFLDSPHPSSVVVDLAREAAARPFPLVLDTGASFSTLTPGLARELGVRVRSTKRSPYRRATCLGRDLQFQVDARRGDTVSPTGREFGLLGGNFLVEYVVEISFPDRRVRFLDPDRYRVPEQTAAPEETVLPLQLVSNRPIVEVEIEGHPVSLLLDTGAAYGVLVGGRVARAAGLESHPAAGLSAAGVMGEIGVEFSEAKSVRVGALEFRNLPVIVAPRGLYQQGTANDSLIGFDLFSQLTLRIDYPRKRVWLRREPGAPPLFLGADYTLVRASGALLFRDGGSIFAAAILPGGAADRIGLQPQDVLEGFDASDESFDPASPHRAIAGEGPVQVRRRGDGGRWRLLRLPP
jgi:predicted aspartyl protease